MVDTLGTPDLQMEGDDADYEAFFAQGRDRSPRRALLPPQSPRNVPGGQRLSPRSGGSGSSGGRQFPPPWPHPAAVTVTRARAVEVLTLHVADARIRDELVAELTMLERAKQELAAEVASGGRSGVSPFVSDN